MRKESPNFSVAESGECQLIPNFKVVQSLKEKVVQKSWLLQQPAISR